jgi:hypothetical protein
MRRDAEQRSRLQRLMIVLDLRDSIEVVIYVAAAIAVATTIVLADGLTNVGTHPAALAVSLVLLVALGSIKMVRRQTGRIWPLAALLVVAVVAAFFGARLG